MARTKISKIDDYRDIPIASHTAPPPDPIYDPVYFTKASVKIGTKITSYGRTSRGTVWVVDTIWTFRREKYGRVKSWITEVRTNHDLIEMHNDETGERRSLTFAYLSETARYRIDQPSERGDG